MHLADYSTDDGDKKGTGNSRRGYEYSDRQKRAHQRCARFAGDEGQIELREFPQCEIAERGSVSESSVRCERTVVFTI